MEVHMNTNSLGLGSKLSICVAALAAYSVLVCIAAFAAYTVLAGSVRADERDVTAAIGAPGPAASSRHPREGGSTTDRQRLTFY
jgi:hypothetical protein